MGRSDDDSDLDRMKKRMEENRRLLEELSLQVENMKAAIGIGLQTQVQNSGEIVAKLQRRLKKRERGPD